MVQIFGPTRTARIINLQWDVVAPLYSNPQANTVVYNPAAMLTTKIADAAAPISKVSSSTTATATATTTSTTYQNNSSLRRNKKIRLEEKDYKNIALPNHMGSATASTSTAAATSATASTSATPAPTSVATTTTTTTTNTSSNLDSVLNQIAGKKQINTVQKSSNDWEGFKETDKTLQDELERTAQGKNAFLVKQDFLNRVDQRKFELERDDRDKERSRRAASSK